MSKRRAAVLLNQRRKLAWVAEGGMVEDGWRVESLLATEERPVGAGTNPQRWHLLVLSATQEKAKSAC